MYKRRRHFQEEKKYKISDEFPGSPSPQEEGRLSVREHEAHATSISKKNYHNIEEMASKEQKPQRTTLNIDSNTRL